MKRHQWINGALSILIVLCVMHPLFASVTGKIAGTVTDKETGNSMPGANVVIVGSTMGAATDMQGNYTILLVPPGTYDVKVTMMGYAPMIIEGARVRIDQTTRIDVELESEVLEGEAVTISAERKIVKEDVSTSVASVTGEDALELPIATVEEVASLQAGVDDGLVIRGGEADEALFQVDGVTLRDPRNNKPITGIALSAIQEISIERGGFNAEYGQVRSGVVNIVTKEGSKDGYHGSATVKYGPPQAKHFGISPFDANSMWMRPYLDDAVCWVGTEVGWADDPYLKKQYPMFDGWNTISRRRFEDDIPNNDLSPYGAQQLWKWEHRRRPVTDQPDYNIDAGFGGPLPFLSKTLGNARFFTSFRTQREMLVIPLSRDDYLDYDWSLNLTSDINKAMKLKVSAMTGKSYNVAINATDFNYFGSEWGLSRAQFWSPTYYMRTPLEIAKITHETRPGRIFSDAWYCPAEVSYLSMAGKFTHMLSSKSFYEVSLEHISREYNTQPIADRGTELTMVIPPTEPLPYEGWMPEEEGSYYGGYWAGPAPYGLDPFSKPGVAGMLMGNHSSTVRDFSKISATTLKADLTSQVNHSNMVKTGLEFVVNTLDMKYGVVTPSQQSAAWVKKKDTPMRGALYVQDKLEAYGFIMNAGLRMDFTNSNTDWVLQDDPFYKEYLSAEYDSTASYDMISSKWDVSLSPRLGISHPITENSKLFFNYGHFKQLPTYEQIFRIGRGSSGRVNEIGDPNLILAKTVSYELGFDWGIRNAYLLQLAAFYHDISDQQAFTQYISADASINYFRADNRSYEDIRGFELTLRRQPTNWWSAFISYTYQVKTAGHFGNAIVYEDPSEQAQYERETQNLYQERPIPQPFARAHVSLYTPSNLGPSLIGNHPLGNWSATVIAEWRDGGWYTWNPNVIRAVAWNVSIRDYYNFTLSINKTFAFNRAKVSFFAEINNLLNSRFLSGASFYDSSDEKEYMNSLHLPENSAYSNIVGEDQVGDFRDDDVKFQPIEQVGSHNWISRPDESVIYYDKTDQDYWAYTEGEWSRVPDSVMDPILEDKAYIDMPNQTTFSFLNPRMIFFGIRTSFDLN